MRRSKGRAAADDGAAGAPAAVAPSRRWSDAIARRLGDRVALGDAVLYVVALIGAWAIHFAQDDAFITYRYARNLARGNGLVLNPGDRVEGYTNFLWTVLHAIPEHFGWSSPWFSMFVGLATMLGAIAVFLRLLRRLFGDRPGLVWLCGAALVTNMTFLGYGTSGLETMLQTLLVLGAVALLLPVDDRVRSAATLRRVVAGFVIGLALLTRLDSAVLVTTIVVVHLWVQRRDGRPGTAPDDLARDDRTGATTAPIAVGPTIVRGLQVLVPCLVVVVPWLVWKLDFYGSLLPNTLAAKSAGNPIVPVLVGVLYVLVFFFSYAAFLLIGRLRRHWGDLRAVPGALQLLAVVPVWIVYICAVGGDFMEFRFMVPILPMLAIVAGFLVDRYTVPWRQWTLVGIMLAFSAGHAVFQGPPYPVLSFPQISHWPTQSPTSWKAMGEVLGRAFPGGPEVPGQPVIAVMPLGIIPYYSDLPTVDMLGLADRETAEHGETFSIYYPGHVRTATVQHLLDTGTNLVIGEPLTKDVDPDRTAYHLSELVYMYPVVDLHELPKDAEVIEIPLTHGQSPEQALVVIYLQHNERVDRAIEENGWRVLPIDRTCRKKDLNFLLKLAGTKSCDLSGV